MKFKTILKSPVLDFVKKAQYTTLQNVFSPNKMTKIEVTTRVTAINYKCNVFFFLYQQNHDHKHLLCRNAIKNHSKPFYNHAQGQVQLLKDVSEQNVSLVMHQINFGATFQCPHSHSFCSLLNLCLANDYLRSFQ